ncbi:MAG: hypothetical protein D6766_06005 [Verrucomicrobia bacterium]|nr:MAG: hypothetical protein D6766_06005 [Verrucomicrobiota bacterium]
MSTTRIPSETWPRSTESLALSSTAVASQQDRAAFGEPCCARTSTLLPGDRLPEPAPYLERLAGVDDDIAEGTQEEWRRVLGDLEQLRPEKEPAFRLDRARRLWGLRRKIIAAGIPLLSWDEVLEEVRQRRGERSNP